MPRKVLRCHQREIARFVHAQMQEHYWEEAVGYEVKISKGFTELKPSAYTQSAKEPPLDYRVSPADKSNMAKYLFGGFKRCLYPVQKFHSDAERKLAVILERDAITWFKPAKGQFQIFYRAGRRSPGVPARLRRRDRWRRSTCWSRRRRTKWKIRWCWRRKRLQWPGAGTRPSMRKHMAGSHGSTS